MANHRILRHQEAGKRFIPCYQTSIQSTHALLRLCIYMYMYVINMCSQIIQKTGKIRHGEEIKILLPQVL